MKREVRLTFIVLMAILSAIIALLVFVKNSERSAILGSLDEGFSMVLDLEAKGIADGYFSWTDLADRIGSGEAAGASDIEAEIRSKYMAIVSVSFIRGDPPGGLYSIEALDETSVMMRFAVMDDFSLITLPGWRAEVVVDAELILRALRPENDIVLTGAGGVDIGYGVRVRFGGPLLDTRDWILIAIALLLSAYPILMFVWRRSVFFYETKGLESIIFLFEQSERFSANHSRRVAALSVFLGQRLGYRGRRLRDLYTAALLHDIGKISIPLEILLKKGDLTTAELEEIQSHPVVSARILGNFRELSHLGPMVLFHHERMDGTGYPRGVKGADIPEESRIIAVVDIFEALTGERPYRTPLTPEQCFEELRRGSLDMRIVEELAAGYGQFGSYQPPRWTLRYRPMAGLDEGGPSFRPEESR